MFYFPWNILHWAITDSPVTLVEEQIIMELISSEDFAKICKTPEGKEVVSKLESPSRSRVPLNLPRDVTDVNITPEAFIITYKGTEFVFRNPQAESIFKRRRPTREEGLEILAACPEIVEAIQLLYEERQSTKEGTKERNETEAELESIKKKWWRGRRQKNLKEIASLLEVLLHRWSFVLLLDQWTAECTNKLK